MRIYSVILALFIGPALLVSQSQFGIRVMDRARGGQ
jgi:hypothetical protein